MLASIQDSTSFDVNLVNDRTRHCASDTNDMFIKVWMSEFPGVHPVSLP